MFYVDVEADAQAESFKPILNALKETTDYLRVLGTY